MTIMGIGSFSHHLEITPKGSQYTAAARGLQVLNPDTLKFTGFEITCNSEDDAIPKLLKVFNELPYGTIVKSRYHNNIPHIKTEKGYVPQ